MPQWRHALRVTTWEAIDVTHFLDVLVDFSHLRHYKAPVFVDILTANPSQDQKILKADSPRWPLTLSGSPFPTFPSPFGPPVACDSLPGPDTPSAPPSRDNDTWDHTRTAHAQPRHVEPEKTETDTHAHTHMSSLMLLREWWERYANNDTHNQPTNIVLGNGKTEEEREKENEREWERENELQTETDAQRWRGTKVSREHLCHFLLGGEGLPKILPKPARIPALPLPLPYCLKRH